MDSETRDNDVYGLIGKLCENIYRKEYQVEEHPYPRQRDTEKHLRRLKSKAYEILLNKSDKDYRTEDKSCDPVVDLLKHSYVLKVGQGQISQAAELEKYLDEFIDNGLQPDSTTYSVLQFLNCLKSHESEDDNSLNVFHYGKPHPQLPEMLCNDNEIPPFQVYPIESFNLPTKFESMLKKDHGNVIKFNVSEPGTKLSLLGRFIPFHNIEKQSSRHSNDTEIKMSNIPRHSMNILSGTNLSSNSYLIPQINDVHSSDDQLQVCKEGIVTEPESPWQNYEPLKLFSDTSSNFKNYTEISEIEENDTEEQPVNLDKIWEDMDKLSPLSNLKTWETLGSSESMKEPPFASESVGATMHLVNVAENNLLREMILPVNIVPVKEFMNNIKLLLLGIESKTFVYNSASGFELEKQIAIYGISSGTLENICYDVILWGTCFKNLSDLIVPDLDTGKLQIEGLIFKALCNSVKEFLLFYHAAILQISIIEDGTVGLLKFLNKVKPLGNIIFKVAELCRCSTHRMTSLGEGIGILTHIYKEVTKVTEQNVALVFYSILKECCEVYFRFLQQWIFEGVCIDIYEEFMIKVRPQYLRTRTHRFWTRGFSINKKSVPGFLSELTDAILQCGKTVSLLKICDPRNPLCRVSISSQPPIRVCLSVGMLRDQIKLYDKYAVKGEIEQSKKVTLASAIREEKEIEKERAELVIAAQQDTLLRLRREREESLRQIAKEKNELLEQLKEQAEEAAQRKERDRDAELLADKLLLDAMIKDEEKAKNLERVERENTIKYYNELAEEANRRKLHADWRIRRMKLFDERVLAISSMREEFINTPDEPKVPDFGELINEETVESSEETKSIVNVDEKPNHEESNDTEIVVENEIIESKEDQVEESVSEDENSNPTSVKSPITNQNLNAFVEKNQNVSVLDRTNQNVSIEQTSIKAVRPTVLDITSVSTSKYSNDRLDGSKNNQNATQNLLNLVETDNMTEAERNKLKVLKQEYGLTPNNNESTTIIPTADTKSELTEIQMNRLRNTQHLTHLNWNDVETNDNVEKQFNNEKTEIQMNRLRNCQHLNFNDPMIIEPTEKLPMTDMQINRNRVMSHHFINEINVPISENTDFQKNRNQIEHLKDTPMSTTTDHFTESTHSSSVLVHSCENTPFSEITNHSDMLYARSSDGMSTDETSQSRGYKNFQITPVFPNFFGLGSVPNTPSTENQQLTIADVEMIDNTSLHVYLEKSVIIPLTVQSKLVNNAIIKYLLNEHQLLSHLHSLRSFFFLLNGEFAKTLTQSLFIRLYEISSPIELFNSSTLTNLLEKALVSSLSSSYANSELVSLSATEVPATLQTSNPEILSCLSLNYKLSWPLNIIFNDIVMQQYSRVFKFLLMVGRVLWVLQEDFHILKMERKTEITNNHHKVQLYRHSMMQFMNALHTYLTCSVLHASWSEFEKDLENATTLDEVYDTHVSYIKKILSRCMLNVRGAKMRTCLCNIFKVVLKFHNCIRSQNWKGSQTAAPSYENLGKMYLAFMEQRAYLAHVAQKLANSGYQPHLLQFLHALNINHRYDLITTK